MTKKLKPKFSVGQVVRVKIFKACWQQIVTIRKDGNIILDHSESAYLPRYLRPLTSQEVGKRKG